MQTLVQLGRLWRARKEKSNFGRPLTREQICHRRGTSPSQRRRSQLGASIKCLDLPFPLARAVPSLLRCFSFRSASHLLCLDSFFFSSIAAPKCCIPEGFKARVPDFRGPILSITTWRKSICAPSSGNPSFHSGLEVALAPTPRESASRRAFLSQVSLAFLSAP